MIINSDLHIHTLASGHAYNTIDECARRAKELKLECIGISDHGPSMEGAPHLGYFEVFYRLPHIIDGVYMLYGCEANIVDIDGSIDVTRDVCANLDYVMAGLHSRTPYSYNSCSDNTKAVTNAIKNPQIDIISHPFRREFPIDLQYVVNCAKEHNTILEINKSVYVLAIKRNDYETIKNLNKFDDLIISTGVSCIIGSDAHYRTEIGVTKEEEDLLNGYYDLSHMKFCNNQIRQHLNDKKLIEG